MHIAWDYEKVDVKKVVVLKFPKRVNCREERGVKFFLTSDFIYLCCEVESNLLLGDVHSVLSEDSHVFLHWQKSIVILICITEGWNRNADMVLSRLSCYPLSDLLPSACQCPSGPSGNAQPFVENYPVHRVSVKMICYLKGISSAFLRTVCRYR